jgi:hypothetical protein
VEVQAPPEVEVRAPRQKIIVDVPPPAAPCPPPAPPCPPPCQPYQGMVPPMVGPINFNQPVMAPVSTEVRERSAFGLMFDTFKLPIPYLRPVAMPRPSEMTMTMPVAPAGMLPMQPAMVPMPGMGQQQLASGSMTLQGSMTAAQLNALLQAAGLGGQSGLAMQLATQLNLSPAQMAQLQALLAAQAAANPAGAARPVGTIVSPAAPAAPTTPAATTPVEAPAPARTTPTSSAPAGASSSSASLEEQLREAEERLKELQALRGH